MEIIFCDDIVKNQDENVLLEYANIDNVKMYKFIDYLIKNENQITLTNQAETPIAKKLYEIIKLEFEKKNSTPDFDL